ncbi:MAG TPA: hypothetical protein PLV68_16000, partial [Ilumatobacteraceae bacterium]|nr:hypothetical protein [Ilumatobacteraceae bacterium]
MRTTRIIALTVVALALVGCGRESGASDAGDGADRGGADASAPVTAAVDSEPTARSTGTIAEQDDLGEVVGVVLAAEGFVPVFVDPARLAQSPFTDAQRADVYRGADGASLVVLTSTYPDGTGITDAELSHLDPGDGRNCWVSMAWPDAVRSLRLTSTD